MIEKIPFLCKVKLHRWEPDKWVPELKWCKRCGHHN